MSQEQPVTSAIDLREALNTGAPIDVERLVREHILLQNLLMDADEALQRAGVRRGHGNVRERIFHTIRG